MNVTITARFIIKSCLLLILFSCYYTTTSSQVKWNLENKQFAPLPIGFNVYKSTDSLDGKPFIAWYAIAELGNRDLEFTSDTTFKRRLTPTDFYEKNGHPLLVVNTTFFSFSTNQNLNLVIKNGRMVAYNIHGIAGRGKDTFTYRHSLNGALGISRKRKADIAWIKSDSAKKFAYASQTVIPAWQDSFKTITQSKSLFLKKWKMTTAVAGGPVLVQNGAVSIYNNEELKFAGNAINDLHPRTLIGYTKENKLVIMVIEGRNTGKASGASLIQAAKLMVEIGCVEALNLDGGGSSCMLINGKETIYPSDKGVERPVPAVFIIKQIKQH